MSTWPTSPEWNDIEQINDGNLYNDNDGVTASDFNAIVENLLYLKQQGVGGGGGLELNGILQNCVVGKDEIISAGDFVSLIKEYSKNVLVGGISTYFDAAKIESDIYAVVYATNDFADVKVTIIDLRSGQAQIGETTTVVAGVTTDVSNVKISSAGDGTFIIGYKAGTASAKVYRLDYATLKATLWYNIYSNKTCLDSQGVVALGNNHFVALTADRKSGAGSYLYYFTVYNSVYNTETASWSTETADGSTYASSSLLYLQIIALSSEAIYISYSHYASSASKTYYVYISVAVSSSAAAIPVFGTVYGMSSPTSYRKMHLCAVDSSRVINAYNQYSSSNTSSGSGKFIVGLREISATSNAQVATVALSVRYTAAAIGKINDNIFIMVCNNGDAYQIRVVEDVLEVIQQQDFAAVSTEQLPTPIATSEKSTLVFYGDGGEGRAVSLVEADDEFIAVDINNTYIQKSRTQSGQIGIATKKGEEGDVIPVYFAQRAYAIGIKATNCTHTALESFRIWESDSITIQFTVNVTYKLPTEIIVSGAAYNWNVATGILTVYGAYSDVAITVSAVFTGKYTSSAKELTSGTELTSSVSCNVGDLVVAAIVTRDTLTLSDGWTLVSTSDINSADTTNGQRLSWAYKFAESTTESITVTQASAQRLYINMVALQGATGVTDNGYTYRDDLEGGNLVVNKPTGLVLWSMSASLWNSTSPYPLWGTSNNMPIIQLGSTSQPRLGLGLDQSDDTSVTFTAGLATTNTTMTVGCLTVQGMDKFY